MNSDIILERAPTTQVLKLDADEQALMNEIEITTKPAPRRRPAPPVRRAPEPQAEIDAFTNPNKRAGPPPRPSQYIGEESEAEEEMDEGPGQEEFGEQQGGGGYQQGPSAEEQPSAGYSSIDDEKADLLNKLARLEKKGLNVNKRLNAYSDITEIRTEYKRLIYGIEAEQSIKFSRRMLIACVTGVEFLNKRYNPFDVVLEGWSESVMENVDDYDGVFEELYAKYRTKMSVAPEIKLMMMLGGSAMMFHLTHSMFKTAIPNMNDVMKQNPDLVKNMMQAVQNTQRNTGPREDTTVRPMASPTVRGGGDGTSARREMQGPGLDISSLMGGIMMPPPPPMNTKPLPSVREEPVEVEEEDDMSDIVSVSGESFGDLKEVKVSAARKRGRKKKGANEVSL
jgi:hypothetical protein